MFGFIFRFLLKKIPGFKVGQGQLVITNRPGNCTIKTYGEAGLLVIWMPNSKAWVTALLYKMVQSYFLHEAEWLCLFNSIARDAINGQYNNWWTTYYTRWSACSSIRAKETSLYYVLDDVKIVGQSLNKISFRLETTVYRI